MALQGLALVSNDFLTPVLPANTFAEKTFSIIPRPDTVPRVTIRTN